MALSLATMHRFIVKEVASNRSIRESMDRIIAKCSAGHPHKDWAKLGSIRYENLSALQRWIETPFRLEPSMKKLAGLWFGLFNPICNDEAVAELYICGSKRFKPNPNDNSWAVGPDWWPENRYAKSSVLARIYKIAYRSRGLGNDAEYPLCLAYGSLSVRELLRSIDPSLILGKSPSLGVAVGFDSGDFVIVGKLTRRGLVSI